MIYITTANLAEARRARRIQFSGLATEFELDGATYVGVVLAVSKSKESEQSWTIKFAPSSSVQRVSTRKPRVISRSVQLPAE